MSSFIDQAKVFVKGGKGGDGMVAFKREKYVPDGGPAGGDGGRGGSVIFIVDLGLRTLLDFRYNRHFKAKPGENGMSKGKYGAGAADLYVKVPAGTIVRDTATNQILGDLVEDGQTLVVAKGGRGGRGNIKFATHSNPAPEIAENGEPGVEREVSLELKILADAGLVGFPSVGKSSIISLVSAAKAKVGAYHFTTLSPNLGVVRTKSDREFVLADLPGLIEGAANGVGLGIQFLRHVERTKVILHVLDMSGSEGRDPFEDYLTINNELKVYDDKLIERPTIIVANKMDMPDAEENLELFKEALSDHERQPEIVTISAWENKGLDILMEKTMDLIEYVKTLVVEEVPSEEHVDYGFEAEEDSFVITRDGDGTWNVSGEKLEKLVKMTNFDHDESSLRFARQLRIMGVDQALRDKGITDGDLVRILTIEFEFVD